MSHCQLSYEKSIPRWRVVRISWPFQRKFGALEFEIILLAILRYYLAVYIA